MSNGKQTIACPICHRVEYPHKLGCPNADYAKDLHSLIQHQQVTNNKLENAWEAEMRNLRDLEREYSLLLNRLNVLDDKIQRVKELPFIITDDEPSRIKLTEIIDKALKGSDT